MAIRRTPSLSLSSVYGRLRRQTSDGRYRPEIDGLRFIAIALVVLGHLMERCSRSLVSGGNPVVSLWDVLATRYAWSGVLLFFVISGFVILNQFRKRSTLGLSAEYLRSYYSRRVLRIEPPYFILLLTTFLLVSITGYQPSIAQHFWSPPRSLLVSLITSLFYLHGLIFNNFPRLFPPGWSLEIEVQFYLVAPFIFGLYFLHKRLGRRMMLGMPILAVLLALSSDVPILRHPPFLQQSLLIALPEFWLGVMLADAQDWLRTAFADRQRLASLTGWIGLLLFTASGLKWEQDGPTSSLLSQGSILLGAAAMFVGALIKPGAFNGFCSKSLISLLGGACYSIYLTHIQVMDVITPKAVRLLHLKSFSSGFAVCFLLETPIVLVVALLFYLLLERPFMEPDWPDRLRTLFVRQGAPGSRRSIR